MNFLGVIAIIIGIVGFAGSYRFFNSKPLKVRFIACSILGILSIPSLLFAIYYLHILPERAWFYTLRSWSGSELFAVFLGGAGGALASLLPRFLLVLPLGLTIVTASVPYLKMMMNPLEVGELRGQWEGDACLQSTSSTCGPASSASILRYLNYPASEREIAIAAYSSSSGTEAWYLARHLRSRGLTTHFDFRQTFTPSVALPAVVGVSLGNFGHFIAVLKIHEGRVTVVDPLNGKREFKLAEFMKAYTFTGFHMTVTNKDR